MSVKNRKSRPSPSRQQPAAAALISCSGEEPPPAGPPAPAAKRPETSGNGGEIDLLGLSPRQQAALPAIVWSPSIAQAARASGVGESTLRRWLSDPDFRDHVALLRRESVQLARQEFQSLMPLCASVFAEAMQAPDFSIRLRAARYALSFIIRMHDMENLGSELRDLEEKLQLRADTEGSPPRRLQNGRQNERK